MAVTIRDVAKRAGVSLITVSRVINGVGYVRENTRSRVLAAVEDLQYIPNQMASSLRSRQSNTLALLLPTITHTFWTTIARGVEDEAESRGYSVFLCNTDDDPAKESRYIDALLGYRVAGVITVPTSESASRLYLLQEREMPFVQVHRKVEDVEADVVRGDSYGGAVALTKHLLDAGARRIAFVGGRRGLLNSRDRLSGYEDALAAAGVALDPDLVRFGTQFQQQTGYALVSELLAAESRPDAIFIANSTLAIGALHALIEAGMRLPRDILVASYYDSGEMDDFSPFMSTAIQPAYEIGRRSMARLFERIAGNQLPAEDLVLPNRIIIRTMSDTGRDPETLLTPA